MTDILSEIEDRERASAGRTLQGVAVTSADRAALAQQYGRELGLPADAVAADFEESQRAVTVQRSVQALEQAPRTRAWLADPNNAAVAHDQVEGLSVLENLLVAPRGVASAVPAFNEGAWGLAATIAAGLGDLGVPTDGARDFFMGQVRVSRQIKEGVAGPDPQSWFGRMVQGASQSIGLLAPGLMATAITKNPAYAIAPAAAVVGGQSGMAALEDGQSGLTALRYGATDAGFEALLERIPVGRLLGDLEKGTGFGRTLLAQALTEVPTESATTLAQNFNEWATLNPDKPFGDFVREQPAAVRDTIAQTLLQVGATTGVAYAAARLDRRARDADAQRRQSEAAQGEVEALDAAVQAVAENPLTERSPEHMQGLLSEITEGAKVYVPAERVAEFFQSQGFGPDETRKVLFDWGVGDQLGEGMAGAELVFDKAAYLAKMGPDAHAFFRDDVRDGEGAMSLREAKDFDKTYADLIEKAAKEAFDAAAEDQAATSAREAVYQDVVSKLREAGYTLDAARPQAQLLADYYQTRAARSPDLYSDAKAAYDAYPVDVRVALPESVRQSYEKTDQLLNALRRRTTARSKGELLGESLLEFVSRNGGVRDDQGEMAAMDAQTWHVPRLNGGKRFRRRLVREDAGVKQTLDHWAQRAFKDGYIDEADPAKFLEAVREELAGRARYSALVDPNQNAADFGQALDDLEELLHRVGLNLDTASNADVKALLERWSSPAPGDSFTEFDQSGGADINSAEFREWFRGSEVVDNDGKPLRVYHATWAEFDQFDFSRLGENTRQNAIDPDGPVAETAQLGAWFSAIDVKDRMAATISIPAYLRILQPRNYQSLDELIGDIEHFGSGAELKQYLVKSGFDGISVVDEEFEAMSYVAFEPSQIRLARAFAQADGPQPRGMIAFDRASAVITLFENRDLSTFLHESGHLWLDNLIADAGALGASEQLQADLDTVLAWMGAASPADITVDMHERWARAVEQYLMEGKAPTLALRSAFERFKAWMVSIYRTVKALRTPLSDEVRGVMDRLLATDEEIAAAKDDPAFTALFATAEEMGATPAQFDAYQKAVQRAREAAHDRLLEKTMAAIRRKRTTEWREEAEALRPAVAAEVDAQPDIATLALLRGGEKLSADGVASVMGDASFLADLPKAVPAIYTGTGGLHPDEVAEMAGYRTGEAMLRDLAALEAERQAMKAAGDRRSVRQARIDAEVERRLLDRHGDVLNDGSIQEEALAALHGEEQGKVLAEELRVLGARTGKTATPAQMVAAWAERTISEKRERDLTPGNYLRAERKAASEALKAATKGDHAEAFRQKQLQLLNFHLYSASKRAKEDAEKAFRTLSRYAEAKTVKGMAQDYLDQIHGLLERFDMRRQTLKALDERASFEAWAERKMAEGETVYVPERLLRGQGQQSWREMTVDELRGLHDAVKSVAHLGRMKQRLKDGQAKREFEEVVQEALDAGFNLPPIPPNRRLGRKKGAAAAWSGILEADASLLKIETLADYLDGDDPNGVFNRLLIRPATEAENLRGRLRGEYADALMGALKAIPKETVKRWGDRLEAGLPGADGQPLDVRRGDLLAMAMNVGNASNLEKLTEGYGWTVPQVMGLLNANLTEPEWAYVQSTWDALEALRPHIARVERELSGVEPEWIDPMPVQTPFGTLRGGYYPAIYDPARDPNADRNAQREADFFGGVYFTAATPKGHTISRTGYTGPLLLDLDVALAHVDKVATRIAYAEYVRDARKFLADRRIKALIETRLGEEYYRQFMPWLQRQVNDALLTDRAMAWWTTFARRARTNMTVAAMGFSVTTGAAQIAGLASSTGIIGEKAMGYGIAKTVKLLRDGGLDDYVFARSEEMRQRGRDLDRDLRDLMKDLTGRSDPLAKVQAAAMQHIAFIDRYLVSTPTWVGAFDQALERGETEADAIAIADKAVRKSQGSGRPYDLSAIQGKNEWFKLFTFAYSYFNVQYNRQREAGFAVKTGDFGKAFRLSFYFLVASTLSGAYVTGDGPDDDDEDGWLAALAKWAGRKVFFGLFAGVPLVRDMASFADRQLGGDYAAFGSTPIARIGQAGIDVMRDIAAAGDPDKEVSSRWIQHAINLPGYALGLPTVQPARTVQYLHDLMSGDQNPENGAELMKGLIKGPQKDQE